MGLISIQNFSRDGGRIDREDLRLREQGERLAGLSYSMAGRLREALSMSLRLAEGASEADLKRSLRFRGPAADRFVVVEPLRIVGAR